MFVFWREGRRRRRKRRNKKKRRRAKYSWLVRGVSGESASSGECWNLEEQ